MDGHRSCAVIVVRRTGLRPLFGGLCSQSAFTVGQFGMSYDIDTTRDRETVIVQVGESFDFRNASEIKEACRNKIEEGARHFIFDCSQTHILDSSGIGVLLALYRQLDNSSSVVIARPSDHVQEISEVTNIGDAIPFFNTIKEARETISRLEEDG